MFKKINVIFMLFLVLGLACANAAPAQTGLSPAQMEAAFKLEAPITAEDVELFVKLGPELMALAETDNEAKILAFMREQGGWNEVRGPYVTTKIANGYMMLLMPEDAAVLFELAQMPASLIPDATEMQLLEARRTELDKIFE